MLNLYVDADACPVKEEIYKVAARYQLKVFIVSNKPMNVPLHPSIQMIVVAQGADEADNWIAEHADVDDIVITADIPLADRSLKKLARALSPRGEEWNEDNIGDAIATRELMTYLRQTSDIKSGPPAMEKKDKSQFLSSLDRVIQAIKKKNKI